MSGDDDGMIECGDGPWPREALRQRVTLLAPGIVLVRDPPKASAPSWEYMSGLVEELGGQFEHYVIVVDLTEAIGRPKGAHWEMLKHTFANTLTPVHVAVVQPSSVLLRQVLRFILASLAAETTVHASLEEAVSFVRPKLEAAKDRGAV